MTENKQTNPEDIRLKVSDYLTTEPNHLRDSSELAFLLGTTNREIRSMVLRERLDGIPIVGNERGYRLAASEEEYRAYARKREMYIDKELQALKLSVFAVEHKGHFQR